MRHLSRSPALLSRVLEHVHSGKRSEKCPTNSPTNTKKECRTTYLEILKGRGTGRISKAEDGRIQTKT
eukprot:scaffold23465_cov105-Skeletonema_marinoi.AAC.1